MSFGSEIANSLSFLTPGGLNLSVLGILKVQCDFSKEAVNFAIGMPKWARRTTCSIWKN